MADKYYSEWTISFEEETEYGTDPGTSRDWIGIIQESEASDEKEERKIRGAGLTGQDYHSILTEKFDYTGNIPFYIQHGKLLQYAIGASNDSGTGPYNHEMTYDDSLNSVTLEVVNTSKSNDWKRVYTGCKFGTLTLSGGTDDELTCEMEWFAQDKPTDAKESASSVTADDRDPYMWKHCNFYIDLDDGSGYQDINDEITSFDLTIERNLDVKQKAGTDKIREPDEQGRDVSLSVDFDLSDTDKPDLVDLENKNVKFKIEAERDTDDSFTLEVEDLTILSFNIPIELEGVVAGTMEAEGLATNDSITFTDSIENY